MSPAGASYAWAGSWARANVGSEFLCGNIGIDSTAEDVNGNVWHPSSSCSGSTSDTNLKMEVELQMYFFGWGECGHASLGTSGVTDNWTYAKAHDVDCLFPGGPWSFRGLATFGGVCGGYPFDTNHWPLVSPTGTWSN